MENRICQIGIIVQNPDGVESVNNLLHEFREYILGRLGLPVKERNLSVISVVLDAPQDVINTLAGRLGLIDGVSAKAVYAKIK